ncbi:hypothetical protein T484DRAFT_1859596 [Baffinella frigidus]|nr:hypothetical protein T484DRAFT_1859596 [Cryptophyta sp. CCMP2293]
MPALKEKLDRPPEPQRASQIRLIAMMAELKKELDRPPEPTSLSTLAPTGKVVNGAAAGLAG